MLHFSFQIWSPTTYCVESPKSGKHCRWMWKRWNSHLAFIGPIHHHCNHSSINQEFVDTFVQKMETFKEEEKKWWQSLSKEQKEEFVRNKKLRSFKRAERRLKLVGWSSVLIGGRTWEQHCFMVTLPSLSHRGSGGWNNEQAHILLSFLNLQWPWCMFLCRKNVHWDNPLKRGPRSTSTCPTTSKAMVCVLASGVEWRFWLMVGIQSACRDREWCGFSEEQILGHQRVLEQVDRRREKGVNAEEAQWCNKVNN